MALHTTSRRTKTDTIEFKTNNFRSFVQLQKDFERYLNEATEDDITLSDALLNTGFSSLKTLKEDYKPEFPFSPQNDPFLAEYR